MAIDNEARALAFQANTAAGISAAGGVVVFTPQSYGAVANGSNDDRAAIQSAIDAANAAGGGRVHLKAGSYKITSRLELKSGVVLSGDGYATRLFTTQTGAGQPTVVRASNISNFSIENLRVEGSGQANNQTTYAISITDGSHDGRVTGCFVTLAYLGVFVGDVSTTASYNISVTANTIYNIGLNGVGVNSGGKHVRVDGNLIYNCGSVATSTNLGAGIEYRAGNNGSCSNNIVRDCNYGSTGWVDGIRLENHDSPPTASTSIVCSNNVITDFTGFGIRGQVMKFCAISGNTITGNSTSEAGILVYSMTGLTASTVTVSGNTIRDLTAGHGIRLEGLTAARVSGCLIGNNAITNCNLGVYLIYADGNTFSGNVYNVSGGRGVLVSSGDGNLFNGEHASGCTTGIQLDGGSDNLLVGCMSHNNSSYGLFIASGATNTVVQMGSFFSNTTSNINNASSTTTGIRADKSGIAFYDVTTGQAQQVFATGVGKTVDNTITALQAVKLFRQS